MDLGKADHVYALLADGTTVEIRAAGLGDFDAVKTMHEQMSPDNTYMRFFNVSRLAAEEEARRICRAPGANHGALLALCGDEVVGVASFYVTENDDPGSDATQPGAAGSGAGAAAGTRRRSRSRWPTACTTRALPPCCSNTWSRWPGASR
jgi:hypothetical protein